MSGRSSTPSAPAIREGRVQPWGVDPKGGQEFCLAPELFDRLAYDEHPGDMTQLVLDAEQLVVARQAKYRGKQRKHVPTVDDPHIVLFLDELGMLTSYAPDLAVKKELSRAIPRILTQARSTGLTVVGAMQDSRKQVVDFRELFPNRIALRTSAAREVGQILTEDAHANGAECEHIPPNLPGVGYVQTPDDDAPMRVRASYFDDDAVRDLVRKYAPLPKFAQIDGDVIEGEIINTTAEDASGSDDDEGEAGVVAVAA